jgi:Clostripain family
MTSSNSGDDDTIRVKRRRPAGPSDTGPRERAETPQRQRPDEGGAEPPASVGTGARPSSGTGSGGAGGFGFPSFGSSRGGKGCATSPLLIGVVILVLIVFYLLRSCGGSQQPGEISFEPPTPAAFEPTSIVIEPTLPAVATAKPRATATRKAAATPAAQVATAPKPTAAGAVSSSGQTWTVMLYQDADDKVLEQDIYFDLNEAERVGSTDRVQIVAQMDRFRGGFSGDGNWTGARRFYVTKDDDLSRVRSKVLADLGEINMSDTKNLIDFVTWAMGAYPADKYVLILSDHGMGWPGALTDSDSQLRSSSNIPLKAALGNLVYLDDLDKALGQIRTLTGLDKFELIGLDACLMSHIEVYDVLAAHARYAVASQEVEPALGWAYTGFLSELAQNPDLSGADLGRAIVKSYIEDDQRIVDDQARAEYMRAGTSMGSLFDMLGAPSSEDLAQQMGDGVTLAAVDLEAIPQVVSSINNLSAAMAEVDPNAVARAKSYDQSFTSIFGEQVPPSYVDLGNLAQLAKKFSQNANVGRAADEVVASVRAAVLAEKHGPKKPGATGISIYFPISQLYRSPVAGPQSYTTVSKRFAEDSSWDDFLAYFFAGKPFEPAVRSVAVPDTTGRFTAPGAGGVQVGPVQLSGKTAAPNEPVTMRAKVTGANAGYAYIFAGYFDQASNSIYVSDMDYLESPNTREVGGIYYPDWGDTGSFTLEFDWEPLTFAITDGSTTAQALLMPRSYGATPEEAVYTVDGIYTFVDGTTSSARLYFSNGFLRQVLGFSSADFTGAPHEITPATGDRFTILERWMDLNAQGEVGQIATQEGKTLTFGNDNFTWKTLDAAAGQYVIGFIVEDLDGNSYESYAAVEVQ